MKLSQLQALTTKRLLSYFKKIRSSGTNSEELIECMRMAKEILNAREHVAK